MKIKYILSAFLFLASIAGYAQVPVPAGEQEEAILLKGGIAHLGNGKVIKNSLIAFDEGRITVVADATTAKIDIVGYKEIDISGQHVYPGFILANSGVGLMEVSSVRAMRDNDEVGEMNPNVRALVAYNTDSEFPPALRFNGVLMAESTPSGGRISGTSSVMNMDGWNWQDAVHTADIGIHLNWPRKEKREFDYATYTYKTEPNKEYDAQVGELKAFSDAAKSYNALPSKERNLKLEALKGLYDGSKTLFIHAGNPKEIVDGVLFAKVNEITNVAVVTGTAALPVKAFLKENNIPVVIQEVHSLPDRVDMDVVLPYRLPYLLTEAGIKVSLSSSGVMDARNLAFNAGTAVAYGMDKEEALKMITSNTANVLGIAEKVGTLEEGKDATLFVSEGDALDIRTNKLSHAYIQGKTIVLDNKHQELYKRYSKKYGHID